MSENYEFITIWEFEAPIERVWEELKSAENWPQWWKGVLEIKEIKAGNEVGIGSVRRSTWKSVLPYKLKFDMEITRLEPLRIIEARAFGELQGVGLWTLTPKSRNKTRVRYDWKVKTTKAWMNFLAPLAKPFFQWNHDVIMNWGQEGLAERLKTQSSEFSKTN